MQRITFVRSIVGILSLEEIGISISRQSFEEAFSYIARRSVSKVRDRYPVDYEVNEGYQETSACIDIMAYPQEYLDSNGDLYTAHNVPDDLVKSLLPVAISNIVEAERNERFTLDTKEDRLDPKDVVAWYLPQYPVRRCGAVFTADKLQVSGLSEAGTFNTKRLREALMDISAEYADLFSYV